jgi:hypothetical protein
MQYRVTIGFDIETTEYGCKPTPTAVKDLVEAMFDGKADWPNNLFIGETYLNPACITIIADAAETQQLPGSDTIS